MITQLLRRYLPVLSTLVLFFISCSSYATTALWIAESNGVIKIAMADETILFEIADADGVDAIAVDNHNRRVWTYDGQRLKAYSAKGIAEVDVAVPQIHKNAELTGMLADTDGVWLAVKSNLLKFDASGQLQKATDFQKPVNSMTLDTERSQLWVAVPEQIFIVNGKGDVVAQFRPPFPNINQLEYDASLDSTWLAGGPSLLRLNASDYSLELESRPGAGQRLSHYLSADGQGGVWGGTRKDISHVNAQGEIEFTFEPFHGRKYQGKTFQDLIADTEDGSVWLANPTTLQQYSVTGALQKEFIPDLGDGIIRAITRIALEQIQEPPEIEILSPGDGDFVNTATPTLELLTVVPQRPITMTNSVI